VGYPGPTSASEDGSGGNVDADGATRIGSLIGGYRIDWVLATGGTHNHRQHRQLRSRAHLCPYPGRPTLCVAGPGLRRAGSTGGDSLQGRTVIIDGVQAGSDRVDCHVGGAGLGPRCYTSGSSDTRAPTESAT
jgi:hypothetical protein